MSRRLTAIAACVLFAVTACSGPEGGDVQERTPAQRLAAAKQHADAASSVHLVVTSRDVPADAQGILGLEGVGTHTPAFQGVLDARMGGVGAKVDAVAIGPELWLKLPFTPRHVKTDPAAWGVPSPAQLLSPDRGLTSLITHTQAPADGGRKREGQEVLHTVTGTVPGDKVQQILNTGDPGGSYQVSYGLTDPDGVLRKASITGPFFAGAQSTYDVVFDRYGEPVDIQAPGDVGTAAPSPPASAASSAASAGESSSP